VLSELRSKFREYLMESTVNFNTKLKEAASFGQPITEYDPGSRGYKDFVNLARELMGDRPVDIEPVVVEKLSRPAELVQRAKQLAQLTNFQFGRNTVPTTAPVESVKVQEKTSEKIGGRFAESEEQTDAPEPAATPAARSTREKIDAFYGVKRIGAEVVFSARFEAAKNVLIAGDFNNWSSVSTPMRTSGKPGEWFMSLPLRPGRYRYRFIVDGQWTTDPHNSYVEANQFGELNNIVEVD
jgi:hypothetical protein